MREILFRGKRVDNGEWAYGAYCHYDDVLEDGKDSCDYIIEKHNGENFPFIRVSGDTVGQYTGIDDLNGTKIFEGDIIKVINSDLGIGEVYSAYGLWYVGHINDELWELDALHYIEVIGNIYDNPELLEVLN